MKYRLVFVFASSVAIVLSLAAPAGAYWVDNGIAVYDTTAAQNPIGVVADDAGGAYILWIDKDLTLITLRVQRVNERGEEQWASGGIVLADKDVGNVKFISDCSGGAFYSYSAGTDMVYVGRIGPDGPLWSRIPSPGVAPSAGSGDICCDGSGGLFVCWHDDRNYIGEYDIFAQRYDSEGIRLWDIYGADVCTQYETQREPRITLRGSEAVIVWRDTRHGATTPDIYAQAIDTTGITQWTYDGVAVCTEAGAQYDYQVTSDHSDLVVVVWADDRNGNADIYAQAINPTGGLDWAAAGEPVCTTAVAQADPQLVAFGPGGAVITWADLSGAGPDWDIKAQYLEVHGAPQWGANGTYVCSAQNTQAAPMLIANSNDVIITWMDRRDASNDENVFAQMLDDSGAPSWTLDGIALTDLLKQGSPRLASDGDGGAIIAWAGESVENEFKLRAQRIFRDGRLGDPRPSFRSISDIADDEGGYVRLEMRGSDRDLAGIPAPQIFQYNVWRRIEPAGSAMELAATAPAPRPREELLAMAGDGNLAAGLRITDLEAAALGLPPGYWESIGLHPAMREGVYTFLAPTRQDSSQSGTHWDTYVISAHSSDPGLYFVSFPDSGYSVDNVAPSPPAGLVGEQSYVPAGLRLTWDSNNEADLWHYSVYRGTEEGFTPGPGNLVGTTVEGELLDTGWTYDVAYWYKVSAVDRHGNESIFAVLDPSTVTGDDPMPVPDATFLAQNYPNPFNPSTTVAFGLKERGFVNLSIYDAAGRLVAVLIDESMPAGQYAPVWDGNTQNGAAAASGVYFYRLTAGEFAEMKKMVLVR